jgi:hypothetical protein
MPGKSLQDSFSLRAQPDPGGTLACDFLLKTHENWPARTTQGKVYETRTPSLKAGAPSGTGTGSEKDQQSWPQNISGAFAA